MITYTHQLQVKLIYADMRLKGQEGGHCFLNPSLQNVGTSNMFLSASGDLNLPLYSHPTEVQGVDGTRLRDVDQPGVFLPQDAVVPQKGHPDCHQEQSC